MANVVMAVGGGIAAYKAATLCSLLKKQGHQVQVLMTDHATRFIAPLTFQSLSQNPVVTDTFAEPNPTEIAHIAMADRADAFVVVPATANLIAKLALGIADDMVTSTALAVTSPVIVAPAMNVHMYEHPTVQENLEKLRRRGVVVVSPNSGPLACGYTGKGRLAEPDEIRDVVEAVLHRQRDMASLSVLITAGPTVEDIDPVRFISNNSSGKMGYELAAAAALRGASVTLVSGPVHLAAPADVNLISVRSTQDMLQAVKTHIDAADVYVSAAAPADFRPTRPQPQKWKKEQGIPRIELEATPDILHLMGESKQPHQTFVGFAAETDNAVEHGWQKLKRKNLDFIVVNNVLAPGAGFAVDTNEVTILSRSGEEVALPLMSKFEVANRVWDEVVARRSAGQGSD